MGLRRLPLQKQKHGVITSRRRVLCVGANARAIAADAILLETVLRRPIVVKASEIKRRERDCQSSQKPENQEARSCTYQARSFQSLPRALFGRYNVSIP